VAAAGTDGDTITSAKRVGWLNAGIRNWMMGKLAQGDLTALAGYVQTSAATAMTANAISLDNNAFTPGIFWILNVKNTTPTTDVVVTQVDPKYVEDLTLSRIEGLGGSAVDQKYYLRNNYIYVIGSGATDTLVVTYVSKHRTMTADDSTADIVIGSQYWDELLKEAFKLYCMEYPSQTNTARLMANQ
jgi:hypothetical protein